MSIDAAFRLIAFAIMLLFWSTGCSKQKIREIGKLPVSGDSLYYFDIYRKELFTRCWGVYCTLKYSDDSTVAGPALICGTDGSDIDISDFSTGSFESSLYLTYPTDTNVQVIYNVFFKKGYPFSNWDHYKLQSNIHPMMDHIREKYPKLRFKYEKYY